MPWILFGSYVVVFPRMYSHGRKWEKTDEETMHIFPPFGSPSTSYCVYQDIDGVY